MASGTVGRASYTKSKEGTYAVGALRGNQQWILGGQDECATPLAVRARGAGAGQYQVVDELALANLIYGRSIDQAEWFFAPRGRRGLFLLSLQFMFDGAGGASDEGNCDKEARGHR